MSKFFDKYLINAPERIEKSQQVVLPPEPKTSAAKAVCGEPVEAETLRIIPVLCEVAESKPELRARISAAIDELFELEQIGTAKLFFKRLYEIEKEFS